VTAKPWRVIVSARAKRDLRKLDPPVRERLVKAIERLAEDPAAAKANLRRLRGRPGQRLRIGDWRVIVEFDRRARVIRVKQAGPRGSVYER
jgi:mRNA interferase RelE/StbE